MLAVEEIEANVAGIKATLQQLLAASDLHASDLRPAVFLNNLVLAHCSMPVVLHHCHALAAFPCLIPPKAIWHVRPTRQPNTGQRVARMLSTPSQPSDQCWIMRGLDCTRFLPSLFPGANDLYLGLPGAALYAPTPLLLRPWILTSQGFPLTRRCCRRTGLGAWGCWTFCAAWASTRA